MNTTRTWMALGLALALGSGGAGAQAAGGSGGGGVSGGAAARAGSGSIGGTAGDGTDGSAGSDRAGTTAPAGIAPGTSPRGPSGTLTPPPVLGDPANPGSFGPGSRDSQGSPAGQGSGDAGGGTSAPGSGVSGVLGPASRASITINASSFRALDADGDSRLGPGEIRDPEMREAFSRLDRDNDGQLSEQEYLFYGRDPDRRR